MSIVYNKFQQIVFFLRTLSAIHVDGIILSLFCNYFVKSAFTFGMIFLNGKYGSQRMNRERGVN